MSLSELAVAGRDLVAKTRALTTDKKGVTAVEYGVIAALIIVVCVAAIQLIGTNLSATFQAIAAAL